MRSLSQYVHGTTNRPSRYSEELPETITNPPEVTEIIPQRLIDSGFKINRLKNAENAGGTTGWVRTTK
jgi:hypothetical protein